MGHRQTVKNQIRRHRTRGLIRFCSVCLQNVLLELLLLPLWESVIVLCFVFMSILVLQSSWWGRESWLLCIILSSWCLEMVERLFLAVPRGCLQFMIVVFPDHTHLLFLNEIEIYHPTTVKFEMDSSKWQRREIPLVINGLRRCIFLWLSVNWCLWPSGLSVSSYALRLSHQFMYMSDVFLS